MSDRILVMRGGQSAPRGDAGEIYNHPQNQFMASFIGAANCLKAKFRRLRGPLADVETPYGQISTAYCRKGFPRATRCWSRSGRKRSSC